MTLHFVSSSEQIRTWTCKFSHVLVQQMKWHSLKQHIFPLLHITLVMFVHTGQPLHKDPGNKTLIQSIWGSLPCILWANCMSWGRIVTLFAWMAHRLVSLNRPMRYSSMASCRAPMAIPWNCTSNLKSWAISWTILWKGSLWMRSLIIFWYLQISLSTTVPGLNWHGHEAASILGTHLPPCESDFCPCMALLGPTDPFHFVFLTWVCYLRASCGSCQACWALARKVPGGFFSLNFAWAS